MRLHGPSDAREAVRHRLSAAVAEHFASTVPADPAVPRSGGGRIPAIDPEDEAGVEYPDQTLLWTRYRRSAVSLGGEPLLSDDAYVGLLTAALAAGTEAVLHAGGPSGAETEALAYARRTRTLLSLVLSGLADLGMSAPERESYLAYHRDWLLRFSAADDELEATLRAQFDARVASSTAAVRRIREAATARWERGTAVGGGAWELQWRGAVTGLVEHVASFRGRAAYAVDPFAADVVHPALFKALHGVANQIGLSLPSEALVYHLLLRAVAADARAACAEATERVGVGVGGAS